MDSSLTSILCVLIAVVVNLSSQVQQPEVCDLPRPSGVDDAIGGLEIAVHMQLAVVYEHHALEQM